MSIYHDPIIITLSCCDPLVYLQTYSPKHGWSQRFYLTKETLSKQLAGESPESITETDLMNVCTVARIGKDIRFKVLWLNGSNDNICGYQQTFLIPEDVAGKVLAREHITYFSYTPVQKEKAEIYLTQTAHKAVAEADKLKRHAIRKFFRDNLNYGRNEKLVVQQDTWVNGFFFFSTVSRYEGGIVLHQSEVKGKDGKLHRKMFYGLHT